MIEPQQVTIYCAAYDGTSGLSHRLLRQAAQLSAPAQTDLTLASGTHGKPYFLHAPQLHFNLSHSGRHWLCAFSGAPVGLDVQQHRACQKQALARRFFRRQSAHFWSGLHMFPSLISGAQRKAISSIPVRVFPV